MTHVSKPPADWVDGNGQPAIENWRAGWAPDPRPAYATGDDLRKYDLAEWWSKPKHERETKTMTKLGEVYGSGGNYLKAADLQGHKVKVTITGYRIQEFDETSQDGGSYKAQKVILTFNGKEKELVCNKTNAQQIEQNLCTDDLDMWIGNEISLYPAKVDFSGKLVDAIRVEPQLPEASEGEASF